MKFRGRKVDHRYIWISLGLFALLIRWIFSYAPHFCEAVYSRGLFLGIRWLIDHTIALSPVATVYFLVPALVFWGIWRIVKFVKNRKFYTGLEHVKEFFLSLFGFLGGLIFLFLFMWGYNYARVPLEEQMHIDALPLDLAALKIEGSYIKDKCIDIRKQIPNTDTTAIDASYYPDDLENTMRELLEGVLDEAGYPTTGSVRGRFIKPKGILLRFSASGVYMPFTGEGHVDDGLHILQKPFTLAHELAHGYGFGDEAICNFLGYLACIRSNNLAIQYSGYLTYWRYVFGELKALDYDYYKPERATISKGMQNDLKAVYATYRLYPDLIPKLQQAAYDVYLKSQGVKEGVKSYDRMVVLIAAWRKK
ncbi:MAG: DUF3810 domain-containing protein [Aureispira sp.]|nr:DUF3810 domain-containing protein [Aureispira sp.]